MMAINPGEEYAQHITETLKEHHMLVEEELSAINTCARGW